MSDKNKILTALRKSKPPAVEAPTLDSAHWIQYDDLVGQFAQAVESVGGKALLAEQHGGLRATVESLPVHQQAKVIYSDLDSLPGTVDKAAITDPHELQDVDLCCVLGDLGVAENGAVWTTSPNEPLHRAILFLTQHLILVLPKTALRSNMHEAYAEIGVPQPGFGVFISGPSKTADIEQSLVIGAHGARSLYVILTD